MEVRQDIAIRLDPEMRAKIERIAREQGRTMSNLIRYICGLWLQENYPDPEPDATPESKRKTAK